MRSLESLDIEFSHICKYSYWWQFKLVGGQSHGTKRNQRISETRDCKNGRFWKPPKVHLNKLMWHYLCPCLHNVWLSCQAAVCIISWSTLSSSFIYVLLSLIHMILPHYTSATHLCAPDERCVNIVFVDVHGIKCTLHKWHPRRWIRNQQLEIKLYLFIVSCPAHGTPFVPSPLVPCPPHSKTSDDLPSKPSAAQNKAWQAASVSTSASGSLMCTCFLPSLWPETQLLSFPHDHNP